MREDRRCAADFLEDNYLSTELRVPVDAAARPTSAARSRPTPSPATSGTTSRRSRTRSCRRSARSSCAHPAHRRGARLHDAGRRARLHAAGLARQPVVDGAVPAEQQRRARSSRARRSRRACGSFEASIEQMLWPETARARTSCSLGDKVPASADRAHDRARATSACPTATCPTTCGRCSDRRSAGSRGSSATASVEIGPIPKGTPVSLLANMDCSAPTCRAPSSREHAEEAASSSLQADQAGRCKRRRDDDRSPSRRRDATMMLELSKCPDFVVNGATISAPSLSTGRARARATRTSAR